MLAAIGAGAQVLGGLLSGRKASKAAAAQAEALRQAGNQAFESSRFRPVGITTAFGSSNYTVDPTTGALTGAGYEASPEIAALQDRLFSQMGGAGTDISEQALQQAQGLFGLGQQYLAASPEQTAADWMQRQQAALAPARERALSGVRTNLFNTGRGGLAVAQGGAMQAANPEMAAYYNSLAQQDLDLAARAQEQGRAATQFGAGLFGTGLDIATGGYNPLKTQFGLLSNLEQAAQQPLMMGADLGKTASAINANAAQARLGAMTGASGAQRTADSWSPWGAALSGMGSAMGGMSMPSMGGGGGMGLGWGNFSTATLPAGWRN